MNFLALVFQKSQELVPTGLEHPINNHISLEAQEGFTCLPRRDRHLAACVLQAARTAIVFDRLENFKSREGKQTSFIYVCSVPCLHFIVNPESAK